MLSDLFFQNKPNFKFLNTDEIKKNKKPQKKSFLDYKIPEIESIKVSMKKTGHLRRADLDNIISRIASARSPFLSNASNKEFVTTILKWSLPCLFKKKRREYGNKKMFDIKQGMNYLRKEMDIVNLVRAIRSLKILIRTFLTDKQQTLIRFQEENVLNSDRSESEISADAAIMKNL